MYRIEVAHTEYVFYSGINSSKHYWYNVSKKKYKTLRRAFQALEDFNKGKYWKHPWKLRIVHYYKNNGRKDIDREN